MRSILTIDLGGTKASYAATRSSVVTVFENHVVPSSLNCFLEQIAALTAKYDFDGIAVAVPGVIVSNRTIVQTPNVPWLNNKSLADLLEERFARPSWLANDMEALALAELKYGALQEARCGLVQTISTGIGGCTCLRVGKAELVLPGEPGHSMFSLDGPACGCGRRGCVEAHFSGGAVRRLVSRSIGNAILGRMDPCAHLDTAADEGAGWALEIYKRVGIGLGIAWANALNQNSCVEKIVYAGTFAVRGMRFMRRHIGQSISERAMFPHHRTISIEQSALWPNGAHLGGAVLFERCEASPATDDKVRPNWHASHGAEAGVEFIAAH